MRDILNLSSTLLRNTTNLRYAIVQVQTFSWKNAEHLDQIFSISKAKRCTSSQLSCLSRKVAHYFLIANIGLDTAENEPSEVSQKAFRNGSAVPGGISLEKSSLLHATQHDCASTTVDVIDSWQSTSAWVPPRLGRYHHQFVIIKYLSVQGRTHCLYEICEDFTKFEHLR